MARCKLFAGSKGNSVKTYWRIEMGKAPEFSEAFRIRSELGDGEASILKR